MQFDSLNGVETFIKNLLKNKVLESMSILVKDHSSDNITSCIYACCSERQCKRKKTLDNGESRDDEQKGI